MTNAELNPWSLVGSCYSIVSFICMFCIDRCLSFLGQRRNLKSRLFKELNQPIDYTPKYTFKR